MGLKRMQENIMSFNDVAELDPSNASPYYGDWNIAEIQLRAHLLASHKGMTKWFKEEVDRTTAEAFTQIDPSQAVGDEPYNLYMEQNGILWADYWVITASQIIRDAYRLYDTFLFESANHLLTKNGARLTTHGTEKTWQSDQREDFFNDVFDLPITNSQMEAFLWIRNKLTHIEDVTSSDGKVMLQSHMSTLNLDAPVSDAEKSMGLYHDDGSWSFRKQLRFTPLHTWRMLDALRQHVNTLSSALLRLEWERPRVTGLQNIKDGTPLANKNEKLIVRSTP